MVLICSITGEYSQARHEFSHSLSGSQTLRLEWNSQAGHMLSHSCQWLCFNTGEQLTNWMWVQQFLLVALAQTPESDSQTGHKFSHSHQWFSKHWRATHLLDMYLAILIYDSDLLKHQRVTHKLDTCSVILISGSDSLKHWSDSQAGHEFNLSCQWSAQNIGEWLTSWTQVQQFLSGIPICSKLESDSLPRCIPKLPC